MVDERDIVVYEHGFWDPDPTFKPATIEKLSKEHDLVLLHMKANLLIGETFTIIGLRKVPSTYEGQDYYYWASCMDLKTKEEFTTILAGQAVVEILDKIVAKGIKNPITVTLDFVKQGAHDGYYIFR